MDNGNRDFDSPWIMEKAAILVRLMKLHIPEVVTYLATCSPVRYEDFESTLKAFGKWQQYEALINDIDPGRDDDIRIWTAAGHLIYKETGRPEARRKHDAQEHVGGVAASEPLWIYGPDDESAQLKACVAELEAENVGLTSRIAELQAEDARHDRLVAKLHLIIRAADEDKLLAIEALDGDNRRLMDAMYKARARVADLEADRNETLEILKAYFDMDIVMPDDKLATLVRVAIAKAEEAERKSEELEAMTLDDHLYRKVGQIADFVEATLKKTEADDETR